MKTPKTLKDLRIEAEVRTLDRIEAESPSIADSPRRRFAVFQAELAALAAEHHLPVLGSEIEDMAAEFAYRHQIKQEEPPSAPETPQETPISDEK